MPDLDPVDNSYVAYLPRMTLLQNNAAIQCVRIKLRTYPE